MKKNGKVIDINKHKVSAATNNNEFVVLKGNKNTSKESEAPTEKVCKKINPFIKILLILTFFCSLVVLYNCYKYYTPKLTVISKMNVLVKFKINNDNRIISVSGENSKSKQAIAELKLKHKHINEGLELLFNECVKQKLIDKKFIEDNKEIMLYIGNNYNDSSIDLSPFAKYVKKNNYKIIINNNGEWDIE